MADTVNRVIRWRVRTPGNRSVAPAVKLVIKRSGNSKAARELLGEKDVDAAGRPGGDAVTEEVGIL